ncbi:signal recognition particle 14 kDa protein-like [Clavelina lepadiformis]|uniref:Signal recognition particle 14 kDa protein n=1 Tax=Clavelina lepadiformis TaxID=159417 RepID=A0ABP0G5L2_CLALP
MVLLENDAFLTELTTLYQKCRNSGTVYVTMKKYDGRTKPKPRKNKINVKVKVQPSATGEGLCLIRATNGKKKLSTVVNAKDINRFQMAYTSVLRANLDGLKKHGKKKAKTKVAEQ